MERYRDEMMVESMFALVKNGKLCAKKTTNGVFIKLTLRADCWATIIMVHFSVYNVCFASLWVPQGQV